MPSQPPEPRTLKGDEGELFKSYSTALRAAVSHHVNTSEAIIEDACSFAWLQLMRCQPDRDTVFGWLRTTAVREALAPAQDRHPRSPRRRRRRAAPTSDGDPPRSNSSSSTTPSPASPHTVLQLLITGHPYNEIADLQSISHGSVNKALVRARRRLRLVHSAD